MIKNFYKTIIVVKETGGNQKNAVKEQLSLPHFNISIMSEGNMLQYYSTKTSVVILLTAVMASSMSRILEKTIRSLLFFSVSFTFGGLV